MGVGDTQVYYEAFIDIRCSDVVGRNQLEQNA